MNKFNYFWSKFFVFFVFSIYVFSII
jgi:hypothetical protein